MTAFGGCRDTWWWGVDEGEGEGGGEGGGAGRGGGGPGRNFNRLTGFGDGDSGGSGGIGEGAGAGGAGWARRARSSSASLRMVRIASNAEGGSRLVESATCMGSGSTKESRRVLGSPGWPRISVGTTWPVNRTRESKKGHIRPLGYLPMIGTFYPRTPRPGYLDMLD